MKSRDKARPKPPPAERGAYMAVCAGAADLGETVQREMQGVFQRRDVCLEAGGRGDRAGLRCGYGQSEPPGPGGRGPGHLPKGRLTAAGILAAVRDGWGLC